MTKTDHLGVLAALVLALCLLALAAMDPARAAFPGNNGKIAFDGLIDNDIFSVNPSGVPAPVRVTTNPVAGDHATYSPDGSRIAFHGNGSTNDDVFVMNSDGTGIRRITRDNANNTRPAWSPDGTRIAYVSRRNTATFPNPGEDDEIFTMNADGSGQRRLTNNDGDDTSPAWSPNGVRLAFTAFRNFGPNTNSDAIMVMNATDANGDGNGDNERVFQANGGPDGNPVWSPDGAKIAWDDNADILVKGSATGNVVNPDTIPRLTDAGNGRDGFQPAWSPDGSRVAFIGRRPTSSDPYDIFLVGATGGTESRVTTNADINATSNVDWQPIPRCTKVGTPGNDTLNGTTGKDVLCGLGGNDRINGGGGNDTIVAGPGNDTMLGGPGNDMLNGGPGTDAASYASSATGVRASLTTGFATGEGTDVFSYVENLTGSQAIDRLTGSNVPNILAGLGGDDTLDARDGRANDAVNGGAGTDTCLRDAGDTSTGCP
jgi:Ca2+-binding RTX toxin-like protein